jgi:hypothetical protein
LKNHNLFAIVPAMKRVAFLLALILASAVPAFAQSSQLGVIVGGSRRFIDSAPAQPGDALLDSNFSFSNSSVDLFWAMTIDSDTAIKFKLGRIEGPIATQSGTVGDQTSRRDVSGQVQHFDITTEYRFADTFGTSAIFGGVGLYRQSASGIDSTNNFGLSVGVNSDFPISRRYGIVVEGTYHWIQGDFHPRFLTVGAGVRVAF